ncbi:hypothetical protein CSV61_08520 [Sporosarcina sp. P3]|nr:hypothetical protein SporoP17a_12430 [Sporosarcina ureae]PID21734.1 hypothetical protein CSV61_08520 [Sporosarcina sp. P3]
MDQPDQVRQLRERSEQLAHRGPMGKRPPAASIHVALPFTPSNRNPQSLKFKLTLHLYSIPTSIQYDQFI